MNYFYNTFRKNHDWGCFLYQNSNPDKLEAVVGGTESLSQPLSPEELSEKTKEKKEAQEKRGYQELIEKALNRIENEDIVEDVEGENSKEVPMEFENIPFSEFLKLEDPEKLRKLFLTGKDGDVERTVNLRGNESVKKGIDMSDLFPKENQYLRVNGELVARSARENKVAYLNKDGESLPVIDMMKIESNPLDPPKKPEPPQGNWSRITGFLTNMLYMTKNNSDMQKKKEKEEAELASLKDIQPVENEGELKEKFLEETKIQEKKEKEKNAKTTAMDAVTALAINFATVDVDNIEAAKAALQEANDLAKESDSLHTEAADIIPTTNIEDLQAKITTQEKPKAEQRKSEAEMAEENRALLEAKDFKIVEPPGKLAYAVKRITKNKSRYKSIAKKTRVPWELIAAIHTRESSNDFGTYLHNGDPLGVPTTNVPKDKLFYTWEDAAVDAIGKKIPEIGEDADVATMAVQAERYNGLGYQGSTTANSPYVWAGTTEYEKGKYVSDGKYDPNYVDKQIGIVPIVIALKAKEAQA